MEINQNDIQFLKEFCDYLKSDGLLPRLSENKIKDIKGIAFEYFLKYYLKLLGFTTAIKTPDGNDGGVDLIAKRLLQTDLDDLIFVEKYYVSAKNYSPRHPTIEELKKYKKLTKDDLIFENVYPSHIRDLRGAIQSGKGILITTGKVTKKAKTRALIGSDNQPQNIPIIVIDGESLLKSFRNPKFLDNIEPMKKFVEIASDNTLKLNTKCLDKLISDEIKETSHFDETDDKESPLKISASGNFTVTNNIPASQIKKNYLPVPSKLVNYMFPKTNKNRFEKPYLYIKFEDEETCKKWELSKKNNYHGINAGGVKDIFDKYLSENRSESKDAKAKWNENDGIISVRFYY